MRVARARAGPLQLDRLERLDPHDVGVAAHGDDRPGAVVEAEHLERALRGLHEPRVGHARLGVDPELRLRSIRSVEGESTSQTQSGASEKRPLPARRASARVASRRGRGRRPAPRGAARARRGSTSRRVRRCPGRRVPDSNPRRDDTTACLGAGRGLRKSSPSRISATLFSGAFSTSSYVARFMVSGSAGVELDQSNPPPDAAASFLHLPSLTSDATDRLMAKGQRRSDSGPAVRSCRRPWCPKA